MPGVQSLRNPFSGFLRVVQSLPFLPVYSGRKGCKEFPAYSQVLPLVLPPEQAANATLGPFFFPLCCHKGWTISSFWGQAAFSLDPKMPDVWSLRIPFSGFLRVVWLGFCPTLEDLLLAPLCKYLPALQSSPHTVRFFT